MAAWLLLHLAIGAAGAWIARRYALRHDLLDQPGERRAHTVPTPRSGGIGIVVALLVAFAWGGYASPDARVLLCTAFAGLAMVATVGLVDDHRPLSPWLRLAVHAVAALLLAFGAWWTWQAWWIAAVAFALAIVLTNVWNFMDGIDGIATTQAVLVALGVAIAFQDGWLALAAGALAAAGLGFLPFNFPKAKLFLGDVGSGALGYALALLLAAAIAYEPDAMGAWLLLPSAFLVDASLTLAGRMWRREAWWRPHALHAYQRWARRLGRHAPVTMAYAVWTGAALLVAIALRGRFGSGLILLSCAAWYIAGTGIWLLLQGKGREAVMENKE